jgi:hypothetical protein
MIQKENSEMIFWRPTYIPKDFSFIILLNQLDTRFSKQNFFLLV